MAGTAPMAGTNGRLRAGVIGLGSIGGQVASDLATAGFDLAVYDVVPDAAGRYEGLPAQCASPADLARSSDVVFLAVVTAEQARQVLSGPDGVLSAERGGQGPADHGVTVVILSTVKITEVRELAALCAEHGAELLDAGVTRGGSGGKLVTMVGGPDDAVERARPALEAFSSGVIHCGDLGAGMITKIARNLITYSNWAVVREAVALATAGGVAPDTVLDVFKQTADAGPTPTTMLEGQVGGAQVAAQQIDYVDNLAQKDLAAAQALAGDLGVETPIVDVAKPRLRATIAGDFGAPLPADTWERGVEMMQRVYGDNVADALPRESATPATTDMVEHLFAQVWARPHLTLRDRRLLTLGTTTMLGRADLLEVQLRGAMKNNEFTDAQLRELELFLVYYAGVENSTSILTTIEKLIAERD